MDFGDRAPERLCGLVSEHRRFVAPEAILGKHDVYLINSAGLVNSCLIVRYENILSIDQACFHPAYALLILIDFKAVCLF